MALLVVAIYLTITEPVFLTWDNLMNIVKSNSVIFVLAIGATFVVITGGIDLSTASAMTATLDDLRRSRCTAAGRSYRRSPPPLGFGLMHRADATAS